MLMEFMVSTETSPGCLATATKFLIGSVSPSRPSLLSKLASGTKGKLFDGSESFVKKVAPCHGLKRGERSMPESVVPSEHDGVFVSLRWLVQCSKGVHSFLVFKMYIAVDV